MYTSCISGWYFIFMISCVISHSSIKITSNTLPNSKAGTFFAVPAPSSGTHTTGGIQPDGVYHWYTPCFAFAFFLSARQSRCTDLMTSVFWHAIRSIHLLAFHTDILFCFLYSSLHALRPNCVRHFFPRFLTAFRYRFVWCPLAQQHSSVLVSVRMISAPHFAQILLMPVAWTSITMIPFFQAL